MLVNEYFANLKGYEDIYMISNYGTIKSTDRYVKNKNGYSWKKSVEKVDDKQ